MCDTAREWTHGKAKRSERMRLHCVLRPTQNTPNKPTHKLQRTKLCNHPFSLAPFSFSQWKQSKTACVWVIITRHFLFFSETWEDCFVYSGMHFLLNHESWLLRIIWRCKFVDFSSKCNFFLRHFCLDFDDPLCGLWHSQYLPASSASYLEKYCTNWLVLSLLCCW